MAVSIVAIAIAVLQGIGAGAAIGAATRLENGHQVETQRERAIDLAARAREIAAMQTEFAVAV